jgi:CheY-like chemotaxis protein/tetratricopeptide (TPR) repeat protein
MKTILVIEDDISVARMLQDVLEAEGFGVLLANDGEWGLRTFQEKSIDLAIIDVLLPKIKGFDLIQKIRELPKGRLLPIVVISGVYRAEVHKERIKEKHGITDYLDKPVDLDRFIDVLHDVFSSAYPLPRSASGKEEEPSASPNPLAQDLAQAMTAPRDGHAQDSSVEPKNGSSGAIDRPWAGELKKTPPPPPPVSLPPTAALPKPVSIALHREVTPLPVAHRGDLAEVPFARLFGGLFAEKANGALMLRKGSVKKIVYLRQGIPVFVKSNLLSECLGRIMVAERLITQEECDRSIEKKKTLHKKQGEILVEMGSISPHNLEFALELQMQQKILDLFSWLEGKFQLNPKDEYEGPQVALSLAPTAMIYEGARRAMSSERIRKDVERLEGWIAVPSRDPTFRYQALELEPRAAKVVDRVDGKRLVRTLIDEAGFDKDDAMLLVYALTCTGLMRALDPAKARAQLRATPVPRPVSATPILLGDSDVEVLSTGEINAVAALHRGDAPAVALSGVSWAAAVQAPKPDAPGPAVTAPIIHSSDLRSMLFEHTPLPEGRNKLDAEMFVAPELDPEIVAEADVPTERPDAEPPAEGPVAEEPRSVLEEAPAMSDAIRRQIRARLDVEAARIAAERISQRAPAKEAAPTSAVGQRKPPLKPSSSPVRAPIRVEDERKVAQLKEELDGRLQRMKEVAHYELFGVHRRASIEDIAASQQRLLKEHNPDRILSQTSDPEVRALAEAVYLWILRAFEVLNDPVSRLAYDRSIGGVSEDDMLAPMIVAERVFHRAKKAEEAGQIDAARQLYKEATDLNASEGAYVAHLAHATFASAPRDDAARNAAFDLFDRAAALSPRSEDVYLLRAVVHQKCGHRAEAQRDYEIALRLNPDCLVALKALRSLEMPAQKKSGILSRLTSS